MMLLMLLICYIVLCDILIQSVFSVEIVNFKKLQKSINEMKNEYVLVVLILTG